MKRLLITIIAFLLVQLFAAQTTSQSSSVHEEETQIISSKSSSSISVKDNESYYKFRANFNKQFTSKIRTFLTEELSKLKLSSENNSTSNWGLMIEGKEVFDCKLENGAVRIFVDKENTTKELQNSIKRTGENLKQFISGNCHK